MKNQSILLISGISIVIGGAMGYAFGSGNLNTQHNMSGQNTMMKNDSMSNKGGANMMSGGTMMVRSEQEFLEGMLPHHQEAVDTAKEVIARGGSTPQIKKLAEDIVTAQEKEITMMKEWYQSWYGKPYDDSVSHQGIMRDLSKLKGAALDKVFLEDMEMHHMGAIMMAKSVQPYIKHKEITELTKAIIETQTAEIELMRKLAKDL